MSRKKIALTLAVCCALLLSGCAGKSIEEDGTPAPTLPPAEACSFI